MATSGSTTTTTTEAASATVDVKSKEDEKRINHEKLKRAFFTALEKKLAAEAAAWKLQRDLDEETESFAITNSADPDRRIDVRFKDDGVQVSIHGKVDESSMQALMVSLESYDDTYKDNHKAPLEYELICNDEAEAEQIIRTAHERNLNITKLSFFNPKPGPDGSEGPPIEKPDLLDTIKAKLKQKLSPRA